MFFATLGILAAVIRYGTYFWLVYKKEARPHVFSWFVWALIVGIGAFVQTKIGGGPSVFVLWMVCVTCLLMSIVALFYGEKHITRGDWISFVLALLAIPVWQISQNPLLTFTILVFIDLCSFYPTWRKMWIDPWSEPVSGFGWSGLRYFSLCLRFQTQVLLRSSILFG